ncbi:MAG: ComEA family DNA-binding protein, partial [Pseudohongiellaceae bacterium]
SEAVEKRVNINEADAETLADVLVGVGASKARAIVKYREENGPFTTIDQLVDVNGIGESILNTNKEKMTLE